MEEGEVMTKAVGFDQKVLVNQLDYTVKLMRNHSRQEMYEALDGYLRNDVTGTKSRKNLTTMLMKIWYLVDEDLVYLRDKILIEMPNFTKEECLAVHWGMMLLAYPFFKDVTQEISRLLNLQDTIATSVVKNRVKEEYGDRRRVDVAVSAVLTTMKAWEVLIREKGNAVRLSEKIEIRNPNLQNFMIQVLLKSLNHQALPIEILQNHPLFFPFSYEFDLYELRQQKDLIFHRHGVGEVVVEIKAG